ncbi:MAG: DNA repair protein RecO [Planctomycetota bacterium]|jgi:DNA repair protein RecO (recombination protein O)
MLTKDLAICIRAIDFSETSQIVTFFTRTAGKISAIAKGSKRPKSAFDGPIEMFSFGKIVFSDSNKEKLAVLTEFEQQPTLLHLQSELFVLNCCLFGAELVNLLTDDYDPHTQLFDNFLQFLQNANERQTTRIEYRGTLALLIIFQLALLKEIGLMPILNACVNCKNNFSADWPQSYFSSSANGLICRDCEASFPDKVRLTGNAANCLTNLKLIAESDEKTLNEIEKVLLYHFTELLGRPPKMAKHILRTSKI